MRDPAPALRRRAPYPRALQAPCGLVGCALLAAALTAGSPRAKASDDHTAMEVIERTMAARSREALAGRASPVERIADLEDHDVRPQQRSSRRAGAARVPHSPTAIRLASLGREMLPMSLRPALESALPEARRVPDLEEARPDLGPIIASLGREFVMPGLSNEPSLSGGSIRWLASADCLAGPLRAVLAEVAAKFGPLRVNSTCRSKRHNAKVGGATRSYHLTGNAADFRISGSVKDVHAFLSGKRTVGGLKHYGFGVFHIDTGPRRTWANKSWANKSWANKSWRKKTKQLRRA